MKRNYGQEIRRIYKRLRVLNTNNTALYCFNLAKDMAYFNEYYFKNTIYINI